MQGVVMRIYANAARALFHSAVISSKELGQWPFNMKREDSGNRSSSGQMARSLAIIYMADLKTEHEQVLEAG